MFGNGKGGKLYASYQERLKILNAADFGDLLLENIRLFREHPDVLRQYQNRFKFILVDEIRTPTSRSICGCGCCRRRRRGRARRFRRSFREPPPPPLAGEQVGCHSGAQSIPPSFRGRSKCAPGV